MITYPAEHSELHVELKGVGRVGDVVVGKRQADGM